ncbi:MAG: relaxase/mobilization nuclease domain-containing protein, partial [Pseudomonadota bacterium]
MELQRSERYFGAPVDAAEAAKMQVSWGMDKPGEARVAQTSHFVVSFPEGTDRDAAERAGRAWAEEMFESGRFGDQWDYYTAYHRDTAYPHIHVVVSRRGMENGDWLKVSNRGALNFDALREVQVEVSEREGIFLEASPRLARGVHARPVPDAEYRRAQEMGRAPVPPAHSEVSAAAAAAAVLYH